MWEVWSTTERVGKCFWPSTHTHLIKLNEIYQIGSRALGSQILLTKMSQKYNSYKMLEIMSHSCNKGKCIRPSNESIHPT